MNIILTVMRKELTDALRDRKTLISAVILPAIAIPAILFCVVKLQNRLTETDRNRTLKVAVYNVPPALETDLRSKNIQLITGIPVEQAKDSVEEESYDAVMEFPPALAPGSDSVANTVVSFYHKSTKPSVTERINARLDEYEKTLLGKRLRRLGIPDAVLDPIEVRDVDLTSSKEHLGELLGSLIPALFISFCFLGCLYPAIDLITGEKEKGTLETLLTVPASRLHLLLGKMLAIATLGICAALMTIAGTLGAVELYGDLPKFLLEGVVDMISLRFFLMLLLLLVPLSLFFAGFLTAIAIRASTFKEAQSYLTPMSFVALIPAMIAVMPGMKLTLATAWIPVLNLSLAIKEIVSGTITPWMYCVVLASLIAFAAIGIAFSISQFSKERNLLK